MKRTRPPLTGEALQKEQALSTLVSRYPREYLDHGVKALAKIPQKMLILPWVRNKQIQAALNNADLQLIKQHPYEWEQINDQIETHNTFQNLTPEDFQT